MIPTSHRELMNRRKFVKSTVVTSLSALNGNDLLLGRYINVLSGDLGQGE